MKKLIIVLTLLLIPPFAWSGEKDDRHFVPFVPKDEDDSRFIWDDPEDSVDNYDPREQKEIWEIKKWQHRMKTRKIKKEQEEQNERRRIEEENRRRIEEENRRRWMEEQAYEIRQEQEREYAEYLEWLRNNNYDLYLVEVAENSGAIGPNTAKRMRREASGLPEDPTIIGRKKGASITLSEEITDPVMKRKGFKKGDSFYKSSDE